MALPSETCAPSLALPLSCKPSENTALEGYWIIVDRNGRKLALVYPAADAERRAGEIVAACNFQPGQRQRELIALLDVVATRLDADGRTDLANDCRLSSRLLTRKVSQS